MKRKYDKKHKIWAAEVKEIFNNQCVVCGRTDMLNAHHLIPWEIEQFRHDKNNGIALCPKHHTKYGTGLSPHSHGSILFALFLKKHYPRILEWVEENYEI